MIVPVSGFGKGHPGAGSDRSAWITIKIKMIKIKIKVQKRQKGQASTLRNVATEDGHSKSFAGSVAEFFFRQSLFGSGFGPLPWGDQGLSKGKCHL